MKNKKSTTRSSRKAAAKNTITTAEISAPPSPVAEPAPLLPLPLPAADAGKKQKPVSHIDHALRAEARQWSTGEVLAQLKRNLRAAYDQAFVVGSWVWVQFSDEPAPEVRASLSQLGFHWSPRRQAWQHPCGLDRDAVGVGGDPIKTYGAMEAAAVA